MGGLGGGVGGVRGGRFLLGCTASYFRVRGNSERTSVAILLGCAAPYFRVRRLVTFRVCRLFFLG